jgi:hypothetical protein
MLFESFGGWFGPPCIRLTNKSGRLLDGRKRWKAWGELCMPGEPPVLIAIDKRAGGRLLLLAHHVDRAYEMLGASIPYDANTAALLRVPPEVGAALVAHVKRTGRTRRAPPRRREEVIKRLRRLYLDCIEEGHPPTPADLRDVLGEWA